MPVIGESPKLAIMQDYKGDEIFHTFGYPGPPNSAAQNALANFVIPDTIAFYTQGNNSLDKTIEYITGRLKQIYR
jgi:hypothetical protein